MKRKMHVSKSVRAAAFCLAGTIGILWAQVAQGEVTWSVDDGAGFADGGGTLSFIETQSLTSLKSSGTNGAITIDFTGDGDSISLRGSTVFELPLSVQGTLSFILNDFFDFRTYDDSFLGTTDKTLFTDMDLSKYGVTQGIGDGAQMTDGTVLTPFHAQRGEGTLTVQLQAIEGGWAKCIKVALSQSGADVKGHIVYARYLPIADYGADFDINYNTFSIATSATTGGYGVKSITLAQGMGFAEATAKKNISADKILIGDGMLFTADGDGVFADATPPSLEVNGTLTITNTITTSFTNTISGSLGTLYFGGLTIQGGNCDPETTYTAPMPTAWTTVATNAMLTGLTNVYINAFSGLAIPNSPGRWICNLTNHGTTVIGQCQQLDGGWIKCAYMEFRQMATNIQARLVSAWYCSTSNGFGVDFETLAIASGTPRSGVAEKQKYNIGSSPNDYVYGVGSFTMFFDTESEFDLSSATEMHFLGINSMASAHIYQRGGFAEVKHIDGLPSGGASVYEVSAGGTLVLDATGCTINRGISNGKTILKAVDDSKIVQNDGNVLHGPGQSIILDNSTLELLPNKVQGIGDKDANDYINNLTLSNGSRVTGKWPRIGYCAQPVWKVTDESLCIADVGMILASTTGHICTFNVEDEDGELRVEKNIITYDTTQHTNVHVRKIGPGTMRWNAAARLYAPIRLDGGTLLLGGSKILGGTYPDISVQLGGGALAAAAGTSNAVGVVTVTNNSSIVVADGAVFTFADSSAKAWAPGMTLSITGEVTGTSVRFGESSAALTGRQQRALRVNGERAMLDPNGYARPGLPGTKIFLR